MARPKSRMSGVGVGGPLVPFVDAYELEAAARGYTQRTVGGQLRQVARLSGWLEAGGLSAADVGVGRVEEFLAVQRAGGEHRASWSRPALLCLLDVVVAAGVATGGEPVVALSPTDTLLGSFERHLLAERGLVAGTVSGYVRHARLFLDGLPVGVELNGVGAAEVTVAVLRESVAVSVSTTQNFVAALKSFLRFCFVNGFIEVDLSGAALAITGRRRSLLPQGITRTDADALLASCDRRSGLGRRDYAMILTLLRLGLRRSELAGLCLGDIDWRAGEMLIRGKGSRLDRLPLPTEVGEAIAAYLKRGRPATDRREVFLRARAPFDPVAPGTVASTVRRACRRAGITEVGAHRLRHTAACEMVAAEVPLVEIAQVLRHKSLQSTALYARVDLDRLRLIAPPWPTQEPGGEQR